MENDDFTIRSDSYPEMISFQKEEKCEKGGGVCFRTLVGGLVLEELTSRDIELTSGTLIVLPVRGDPVVHSI